MGLRARLMLLVGTVVLASLAAVAFYSGQVASRAYLEVSAESEFNGAAVDLGDAVAGSGQRFDPEDPAGWSSSLARLAEPFRDSHWLLAFDARRSVVATSEPALAAAVITLDGNGRLEIERRATGADGAAQVESLEVRVPVAALVDDLGKTFGYLVAVPRPVAPEVEAIERRRIFRSSVSRYLVPGVAAVGLLALLATHLVSMRLLGPIEALTRGVRRMAQGDLGARVPANRNDEVGELATAFNEMAEGFEAIERWRQHMLNDTAHELRTPLTNLRCRIEAMEDGLVPTDGPALTGLAVEVQRLSRLVDDLRDLALAEAHRLVLDREPLSLNDAVASVVAALPDAAGRITVDAQGDDTVDADPRRVDQILSNLVRNALVHGGPDSPVSIQLMGSEREVAIHVEDLGPGLVEAEIPRLFERFYRSGEERTVSGTGLGLAIVRELVQAHGGTVAAANRQGGGARFTIRLPRSEAAG